MKIYDLNIALSQQEAVTALYLSNRDFNQFPAAIFSFKNLEVLDLSACQIRELPTEIASLAQLHTLVLDHNRLQNLPASIGYLPLRVLSLTANNFSLVPSAVMEMAALRELSMANNTLQALPDQLFDLKHLIRLDFSGNQLSTLQDSVKLLPALRQLRLGNNRLAVMPAALFQCKKLETLALNGNQFKKIPAAIGKLEALENLDLSNNALPALPVELGHCQNLRRLRLYQNQLRKLPEFQSPLKHLFLFDAGYNHLSQLPAWLGACTRIEELDLSENRFRNLPEFLAALPRLSRLDVSANSLSKWPALPPGLTSLKLSDNPLKSVPASIGQLSRLRELFLDRTKLQRLPADISKLKALETLSGQGLGLKLLPKNLLSLHGIQHFEGFFEPQSAMLLQQLWKIARKSALPANQLSLLYDAMAGAPRALSKMPVQRLFDLLIHENLAFFIRGELFRRSQEQPNQPLQAGTVLYCAGNPLFELDELQERLEKQGIEFATRPNKHVTHVLLGDAPAFHPALAKRSLIFLNEQTLTRFLDHAEKRPLAIDPLPKELENLRQLLLHKDPVNVEIALRMMQAGGVPEALWHELLAIFMAQWPGLPKHLRTMVGDLLALNLSEQDKQLLYTQSTGQNSEASTTSLANLLRETSFDPKRILEILKALGMP